MLPLNVFVFWGRGNISCPPGPFQKPLIRDSMGLGRQLTHAGKHWELKSVPAQEGGGSPGRFEVCRKPSRQCRASVTFNETGLFIWTSNNKWGKPNRSHYQGSLFIIVINTIFWTCSKWALPFAWAGKQWNQPNKHSLFKHFALLPNSCSKKGKISAIQAKCRNRRIKSFLKLWGFFPK